MSELIVVPLLFKASINGPVPVDPELHTQVVQYCHENLAELPNFLDSQMAYAVAEYGDSGELLKIHGVSAERPVHDIGVFRVSGPLAKQATVLLYERWQAHFSDLGWRGQDVMIWIDGDEKPEQQCENRAGSIKAFGLRPSKRMLVKVR